MTRCMSQKEILGETTPMTTLHSHSESEFGFLLNLTNYCNINLGWRMRMVLRESDFLQKNS